MRGKSNEGEGLKEEAPPSYLQTSIHEVQGKLILCLSRMAEELLRREDKPYVYGDVLMLRQLVKIHQILYAHEDHIWGGITCGSSNG